MELFKNDHSAPVSADTISDRVIADARIAYGSRVTEDELDALVRTAVQDLWGDSILVSTFVPLLAMRQVRESLDAGTIIAG